MKTHTTLTALFLVSLVAFGCSSPEGSSDGAGGGSSGTAGAAGSMAGSAGAAGAPQAAGGAVGTAGAAGSMSGTTGAGGTAGAAGSMSGTAGAGGTAGAAGGSAGSSGAAGAGGAPAPTGKANGDTCDVSSACASGLCCFAGGSGTYCEAGRSACDMGGGVTLTPTSRPETGIDVPCRTAADCGASLTADHAVLKCSGYVAPKRGTAEVLGFCVR